MTDSTTPPPPPPGDGQPPFGGAPSAPSPLSESEGRTWATLAHVGIAASAVIGITIFAPLVIWLLGKDRSAYVDEQGKEALNFSILLMIIYVVGLITTFILIGFVILFVAWLVTIIFGIMAAIAASRGDHYRYPFNWRIVK